MLHISLNTNQFLELTKLTVGCFDPLHGFMTEEEFNSVVSDMRLPSGKPFPLPVYLDVDVKQAEQARTQNKIALDYKGEQVGELEPSSVYTCDKENVAKRVFGTTDMEHPGVRFFRNGGDWFIGGRTTLFPEAHAKAFKYELTPEQTRQEFVNRRWKTIVGFQTRNVPHRAHEYLQRVALEQADGLFIQPLIGRKKTGDYTADAILAGYRALIEGFYPKDKVLLGVLTTAMRYAGPRESIFHAIIRRNYGCTHFIIGRDHAGVGNYYGKYEAHELSRQFDGELGINIVRLHGPYYCQACDGIVTEHTCQHYKTNPELISHISGTLMRSILADGVQPDKHLMRPEVVESVRKQQLFIEEED